MTATPDRPATTPEGAGLAAVRLLGEFVDPDDCWFDHAGGCQAHGFISLADGERCPNAEARDLLAHLPERTDEAKGVALSEALTSVIRAVTDVWDEPLDEVHDLPQIVNALLASGLVLARRALPTAGRVVEVERVAEQVEELRLLIEAPSLTGPTTGEAVYVSELRPIYAALAAAIRADGSAES